jgi:hypothetical protein
MLTNPPETTWSENYQSEASNPRPHSPFILIPTTLTLGFLHSLVNQCIILSLTPAITQRRKHTKNGHLLHITQRICIEQRIFGTLPHVI